MATRTKRPPHRLRRGSIYVMVLGTTMIVAVLGLAALTIVRVQRIQNEGGSDMRNAQAYAKVALDMAWYRIENDPLWRKNFAAGTWATDQVVGDGFYRFTATDPTDGNLLDSMVDPVVIVGVGTSGNATQKLQMEIRALQPGIRCLEASLHGEKVVTMDGGTVTSDQMISANDKTDAKNNVQVYADAEAYSKVKGGVYHGWTTTAGTWPREMPNIATVYSYYTSNGTTINYNDLPWWDENLIDNPGAEASVTNISPWYAVGCTGSVGVLNPKSGLRYFRVTNRNSTADYLAQDVTAKLQNGVTYYTEAWVRTSENNSDLFTVKLKVVAAGSGTQIFDLTATESTDQSWKELKGTQTVTWTGTLTQAELYVWCDDYDEAPCVDDVIMREDGAPNDVKVIHRQVLSPASNPFGSTNSQGIYVIDCDGDKISIRDSRIVGTLVLLNQNAGGSEIAGSMHWSPAVISADPTITNLPALLSNEQLNLFFTNTALDEGLVNANFNPSGTPYNGSQDSDKSDSYPSVINGIVYCETKVVIENSSPAINGILIGHDNIDTKDATLTLKYDPLYFEWNAPPGFQAAVSHYIVPGSYRQVVD